MWGQIRGEAKIVTTRSVIDGLPAEQAVGLLAYGHRRDGDCQDIEHVPAFSAMEVQ